MSQVPKYCCWVVFSVILKVLVATSVDNFDELQREFGEWRLKQYPEFSTFRGFYKYNDRLDSFSEDMFETLKSATEDYLSRLRSIPYSELPAKKQIDYDILESTLKTLVDGYQWRFYSGLNPISHMNGPQRDPDTYVSMMPFDTKGDYENYLTRLEKMPQQMEEMKSRMNRAIAERRTYPTVSMTKAIGQFDRILTTTPEQFAFYKPFNETLLNLTTVTDSERIQLQNRGKTAVNGVLLAYRSMRDFITTTYIPNARTNVGVSSWDNGSEFYKACLRWHTSLNITPEEVHKTGLDEVHRISTNMRKVMSRLGTFSSIKEFFASLQGDPRFFKTNKTQILDLFNDMVFNEIDPTLPQMFKDLPGLPVRILESPTDGSLGYYRPGSDDGSRPGTFYVNLFRPTEMNTVGFMALAIHETNPGHHLQISIANTADLPFYRKYRAGGSYTEIPFRFPSDSAYIEGWALYSEALGEELHLYKDDYYLMGRYSSEMFRACRLVVDTGIHYFNYILFFAIFISWTKEEAVEFMLNYTSRERTAVENEIDRYSVWPGQACAYKMGEIKIKQLKQKAQIELGDKFDIKEFHSAVLKDGVMSLATLEKIVMKWIEDTKMSDTGNARNCISIASKISFNFSVFVVMIFLKVVNFCN